MVKYRNYRKHKYELENILRTASELHTARESTQSLATKYSANRRQRFLVAEPVNYERKYTM